MREWNPFEMRMLCIVIKAPSAKPVRIEADNSVRYFRSYQRNDSSHQCGAVRRWEAKGLGENIMNNFTIIRLIC